jgi:hypothetical protein
MDSGSPTTVPLDSALIRYRKALACLNAPKISLSTEQALEIRPLEKIFCAIVKDYFFPEIFLNKITIIFQFFE